jgi:hypothetical protein
MKNDDLVEKLVYVWRLLVLEQIYGMLAVEV